MSKEQKQRDILFDACKQVATNKRTPEWISGILTQAVMAAKSVKDDTWNEGFSTETEKTNIPPAVGKKAKIKQIDNVLYKIQIIQESETVDGVTLWHVKILEGNGPHKVGTNVYNVPGTWIFDVEE